MSPRLALTLAVLVALPCRAVDVSLGVGALEVVLLPPAHGGFYPYVGAALTFPLSERLSLTTALSFEFSPDQRRGGLVFVATGDWRVSEHLGVDLNLAAIHDQAGFDTAVFFVGGGPGLTVFLGRWALSPFVSVFAGPLGPHPVPSLVPGLNLAFTL